MKPKRRGFSLVELMVALLVSGVIALALTRLVISQSRFVAIQDALMRARGGARAALIVSLDELRMVGEDGVIQANRDSFTVHAPIGYGVVCSQSGGVINALFLPADSATFYATPRPDGYGWRDALGSWQLVPISTFWAGPVSDCMAPSMQPSVTLVTGVGWAATVMSITPGTAGVPIGGILYAYRTLRYAFAPSVQLPGRRALWRTELGTGRREELVAPFDTAAGFTYLVGAAHDTTSTPAVLDSVRGVRMRLVTQSEGTPLNRSAPVRFDLTTDLLFRNRAH